MADKFVRTSRGDWLRAGAVQALRWHTQGTTWEVYGALRTGGQDLLVQGVAPDADAAEEMAIDEAERVAKLLEQAVVFPAVAEGA